LTGDACAPGERSPVTGRPLCRSLGAPTAEGSIRSQPEDFRVDEVLGFEPDGEGSHTLVHVRGTRVNTQWVARRLARFAGVPARDVGFCGLKDRVAVTTQWFSIPGALPADAASLADEGIEVLRAEPHRRKLRRGSHCANAFRIVVRDVTGSRDDADRRLAAVARRGVPNYFGPQRFGRDAGNLDLARALTTGRRLDRRRRGFALSAARAAIFNEVLSRRVAAGTWSCFIRGEVAMLAGSSSWFPVDDSDPDLGQRLETGDVHPSGPMWGDGVLPTTGDALELERTVGEALPDLAGCLESARLRQERRSLRLIVQGLEWEWTGDDLALSFSLPRGAFATAVLAEVVRRAAAEPDARS
jgi:tRNA pseudouridine13 synthase